MSTQENLTPGKHQKDVLMNHNYDGIQEYDNMMPGWWAGIFIVCIIWAAIYLVIYYDQDTYGDDLKASLAELKEIRSKSAGSGLGDNVTEAQLTTITADKAQVAQGQKVFTTNCVACHGPQGGGGIGANLTDEFWIHGGKRTDVFTTITKGFTAKGMPAWEASISPTDRAALVAYVYSIMGTNVAGGKAPQGDKFDPNAAAAPAPAAEAPKQ